MPGGEWETVLVNEEMLFSSVNLACEHIFICLYLDLDLGILRENGISRDK